MLGARTFFKRFILRYLLMYDFFLFIPFLQLLCKCVLVFFFLYHRKFYNIQDGFKVSQKYKNLLDSSLAKHIQQIKLVYKKCEITLLFIVFI